MRELNFENLLFCAIEKNGSIEMIEDLLKTQINLYATNENGRTPMMLAARIKPQKRAIEICELLINSGGKVQICTFREENNNPITPIYEAEAVGNQEVAEFLLNQIFDVGIVLGQIFND
jgi:ankyrin repeat protein